MTKHFATKAFVSVEQDGKQIAFWGRIPTRRDRWVYRFRCLIRWTYMRQTRLFYRPVTWWMNR